MEYLPLGHGSLESKTSAGDCVLRTGTFAIFFMKIGTVKPHNCSIWKPGQSRVKELVEYEFRIICALSVDVILRLAWS